MQREILFGKEGRDKILSGVQKHNRAVAVTMGAAGRCVLIGKAVYGNDGLVHLPSIISKDGYTVSRNFELSDPMENRGSMLIQEATEKTVSEAGDATTCTSVLSEAIISGGIELVNNGSNSMELKKGIDKATETVVNELKRMSTAVAGDNDKIYNVACVSANNDSEIGRYISDAYKKIGDFGVIDIETSNGINTAIKLTDGFKWDKGWVSQLFVTNAAKQTCEFENPIILLYDKKITHHTQLEKALQISIQSNRPLVIICDDAEGEGLAYLAINNNRKAIRVCVVKSPEFGDARRQNMEDMAVLTGGTHISDIHGIAIAEVEEHHFGSCQKITISKDETVIIRGNGDKDAIEELVNDLKMNLAEAKTEDAKYPIEKRIAKLTGGVAVIQVGAATESELGEKLDRYDDAVRSVKAAIQEGYVVGGGTAFLRISQSVGILHGSEDFKKGQQLLYNSLLKPFTQIVSNAGLGIAPKQWWEFWKKKTIIQQVSEMGGNYGYNVKTEQIENLIETGIIDSTKALRCALINSASVAGVALTSECLIVTTS